MKEIISEIIKIECGAEEIYREAKAIDTDGDKLLENAIEESRDRSDERMKVRLEQKETECRKEHEAKVLEINVQKELRMKKLQQDFEENKSSYVEKLYKKVLEK